MKKISQDRSTYNKGVETLREMFWEPSRKSDYSVSTDNDPNQQLLEMINSLKIVDNSIRRLDGNYNLVESGKPNVLSVLKDLLGNASTQYKRLEYMVAFNYISQFHDIIEKISQKLNEFSLKDPNHEAIFMSGLTPEQIQKLKEKHKKVMQKKAKKDVNKGLADFWHNITSNRAKALKLWEKFYPQQFKELKSKVKELLEESKAFYSALPKFYNDFDKARSSRDITRYINLSKAFFDKYAQYDAKYNSLHSLLASQQFNFFKDVEQASENVFNGAPDTIRQVQQAPGWEWPEGLGADEEVDNKDQVTVQVPNEPKSKEVEEVVQVPNEPKSKEVEEVVQVPTVQAPAVQPPVAKDKKQRQYHSSMMPGKVISINLPNGKTIKYEINEMIGMDKVKINPDDNSKETIREHGYIRALKKSDPEDLIILEFLDGIREIPVSEIDKIKKIKQANANNTNLIDTLISLSDNTEIISNEITKYAKSIKEDDFATYYKLMQIVKEIKK